MRWITPDQIIWLLEDTVIKKNAFTSYTLEVPRKKFEN